MIVINAKKMNVMATPPNNKAKRPRRRNVFNIHSHNVMDDAKKPQLLRLLQPNCDLSLSLLLLLLQMCSVHFIWALRPRIKIKKFLIHLMEIPRCAVCMVYGRVRDGDVENSTYLKWTHRHQTRETHTYTVSYLVCQAVEISDRLLIGSFYR